MKRLAILAAMFIQSGGNTVNVPIVNPSFEDHPNPLPFLTTIGTTVCGREGWNNIPGWNLPAATAIYQPDLSLGTVWPCYNTQPPDGASVAMIIGAIISQDLGIKIGDLQTLANGADGDGVYVMKFWVANFSNAYPGYYEAKILVGPPRASGQSIDQWLAAAHELCSTDGPGRRHWQEITLVCNSPSYLVYDKWPPPWSNPAVPANPNDHLILTLSATGWTLMFDKVSLTFTPQS